MKAEKLLGDLQNVLGKIWELITVFGLQLIAAIAVFIVGRWVCKLIRGFIEGMMQKAKVEQTLRSFTVNLAYVAMMAFVVIAALGQLGIQTTSFAAILGAAGLAVGLALQGSLSNFAAGVMMIIFRPFKVLKDPAPAFVITELVEYGIKIVACPWVSDLHLSTG